MEKQTHSTQRHYPAIYEKLVPLALIFIVMAIAILLMVTLVVAFHLF